MKTLRLYIIAALVTLTFVTCSKSEDDQPPQQQQEQPTPSGDETEGSGNENPEGNNTVDVENVNNDYSDQPAFCKHV